MSKDAKIYKDKDISKQQDKVLLPFQSHVPSLLYLTGIFFLNFLGRVVLAPLMPTVERDLNVGHGEAGSLFLFVSLGYFAGLLGSGFLSSHSTHRRTIILFPLGIMLVGLLLMGGIILVQYLKFHEEAIQTIA